MLLVFLCIAYSCQVVVLSATFDIYDATNYTNLSRSPTFIVQTIQITKYLAKSNFRIVCWLYKIKLGRSFSEISSSITFPNKIVTVKPNGYPWITLHASSRV